MAAGPCAPPMASWLALWEAAASHVAENRGATASVALLQVSIAYSVNLHSASSACSMLLVTQPHLDVQRGLQLAELYRVVFCVKQTQTLCPWLTSGKDGGVIGSLIG